MRDHHSRRDESQTPPEAAAGRRAAVVLTRDAARAVDRAAEQEFGIPGIVLMENAALGLLRAAKRMLATAPPTSFTLVVCGTGNNGGDGYALARHLDHLGRPVMIVSLGEPRPGSDAALQAEICLRMKLRRVGSDGLKHLADFEHAALVVDAIFGTGLERPVQGEAARIIEMINAAERPVLAADLPSGLDADTGNVLGKAVQATHTVTFAGLKPGLLTMEGRRLANRITVADIGVPRELLARFGVARHDCPGRDA